MTEGERAALVSDLCTRLAQRGVPQGTWLVELSLIREELETSHRHADAFMRRLQDALIEAARESLEP